MNKQAFAILEFDELRALVRRGAQTDMARRRIEALEPLEDLSALHQALREVAEAQELRQRGARLSFQDVADPAEAIARLKIAGTALEPLTILELVKLCVVAHDARSAVLAERENCPTLFGIVASLPTELQKLANAIHKKILPNGEIDDRASPELVRIRHEIARLRSSITRSLENLMRQSSDAIQEELVTLRNDRFVIPVRADHRGRINGVAHGASSSGATIFVEPLQTIESNNQLQTLREAEQREIAEILFQISQQLRRELPAIEMAAEIVAELDFVSAKATFAERFNCVVPVVPGPGAEATGSFPLELIDARHPLLEESLRSIGREVVPASFTLDAQHTAMVISGANAGGKTVVLKTAGLLSLMACSGLPVPARTARIPFYRSVLADIGDHQSLAANLSTFTSHMGNIAAMIEACETPALVLLDEAGTGTDPEEGSALGVAIVDNFKQKGAHVLATTHYSGLKMYAANEPGVLNASVEFDEKSLRPTYHLLVGLAGSSSGLEIARRFGIPAQVITAATAQVKQSSLDAVEYLRRIKAESEEAETLRRALEEERAAVAEKFANLDREFHARERARQADFEKEVAAIVADFEKRSEALVAEVQERADRLKIERESQKRAAELKREAQQAAKMAKTTTMTTPSADKKTAPALRGVRIVRDGQVVSAGGDEVALEESAAEISVSSDKSRELRVGDRVRVLSLGSIGTIDQIKGDEVQVRVGSIHLREKLSNLELIVETGFERHEVGTSRGSGRVKASLEELRRKATTTELHLHSKEPDSRFKTNTELNLIGKTTDEAVDLADKFLDQAFLEGQSEVRIIHGHGTGALRKAIAEFLGDHPHVERFMAAAQDKGGSGATVVQLRQ